MLKTVAPHCMIMLMIDDMLQSGNQWNQTVFNNNGK